MNAQQLNDEIAQLEHAIESVWCTPVDLVLDIDVADVVLWFVLLLTCVATLWWAVCFSLRSLGKLFMLQQLWSTESANFDDVEGAEVNRQRTWLTRFSCVVTLAACMFVVLFCAVLHGAWKWFPWAATMAPILEPIPYHVGRALSVSAVHYLVHLFGGALLGCAFLFMRWSYERLCEARQI